MAYDAESQLNLDQYHSLVDLIEKTCQQYGNNIAYACLGKNTTFKEIESASRHFAAYLQNHTDLTAGTALLFNCPILLSLSLPHTEPCEQGWLSSIQTHFILNVN